MRLRAVFAACVLSAAQSYVAPPRSRVPIPRAARVSRRTTITATDGRGGPQASWKRVREVWLATNEAREAAAASGTVPSPSNGPLVAAGSTIGLVIGAFAVGVQLSVANANQYEQVAATPEPPATVVVVAAPPKAPSAVVKVDMPSTVVQVDAAAATNDYKTLATQLGLGSVVDSLANSGVDKELGKAYAGISEKVEKDLLPSLQKQASAAADAASAAAANAAKEAPGATAKIAEDAAKTSGKVLSEQVLPTLQRTADSLSKDGGKTLAADVQKTTLKAADDAQKSIKVAPQVLQKQAETLAKEGGKIAKPVVDKVTTGEAVDNALDAIVGNDAGARKLFARSWVAVPPLALLYLSSAAAAARAPKPDASAPTDRDLKEVERRAASAQKRREEADKRIEILTRRRAEQDSEKIELNRRIKELEDELKTAKSAKPSAKAAPKGKNNDAFVAELVERVRDEVSQELAKLEKV